MKGRKLWTGGAVLLALGLVGGATVGGTFAAFRFSTSNGTNTFSAAPDWVGPSASATVIGRNGDCSPGKPGFIKQGASYYVYATVADSGNPASGIATVNGNVSSVSTGQNSVALAAGAYSAGGTAYNHRTASVTANNPLANGNYTYSLTSKDNAGNTNVQPGFPVVVDNTAPGGVNVQTANGPGTAGLPDLGDTVTFTYSEPIEPCSILAGWSGAATNVVVQLFDVGGTPDYLGVLDMAQSMLLGTGFINLGPTRGNYTSAGATFGSSGTPSTMVASGSTITVTLGTLSAGSVQTAPGTDTMVWTPSANATDNAGNACSTTNVNESGPADKEF